MLSLPPRLGGLQGSRTDDAAVRDTNDDAQLSKLSCVRHGYFQDAFVHHFVRRPARRSPLINRGYFSRYAALRGLLLQFLALGLGLGPQQQQQQAGGGGPSAAGGGPQQQQQQQQKQEQQQGQEAAAAAAGTAAVGADPPLQEQPAGGPPHQPAPDSSGSGGGGGPPPRKQVLVLGAGYDTTYFQLAAEGALAPGLLYVELDFPQVTQKKAAAIQQLPELRACLGLGGDEAAAAAINAEEGRVVTSRYCLLPADLRELSQVEAALQAAGLDPAAPTFVLSECVLVYLQPQHSRAVVRWLADHLSTAAMAVYEQIKPHDAFGQQMMINLESRGCALLGIEATPSLEAQRQRFTEAGWHRAEAHSMDHVYSRCINPADRRRIERLEIFDEFEEWHLIQQHYCIAVGVKDETGLLSRFGLPQYAAPGGTVPQSAGLGGGGGLGGARPGGARPPVPRFFS